MVSNVIGLSYEVWRLQYCCKCSIFPQLILWYYSTVSPRKVPKFNGARVYEVHTYAKMTALIMQFHLICLLDWGYLWLAVIKKIALKLVNINKKGYVFLVVERKVKRFFLGPKRIFHTADQVLGPSLAAIPLGANWAFFVAFCWPYLCWVLWYSLFLALFWPFFWPFLALFWPFFGPFLASFGLFWSLFQKVLIMLFYLFLGPTEYVLQWICRLWVY